MLKRYAVMLAFVVTGACTSPPVPENIRGNWTPVSVRDCGPQGRYVSISTRIIRLTEKQQTNIFMFVKRVDVTDTYIDIHYSPPAMMSDTPDGVVRFDRPSPDRIRAVGSVDESGRFSAEQDPSLSRFDLIRCDAL